MLPKIINGSPTLDYNQYFVDMVTRWCQEKGSDFKSQEIVVTSGPWRNDAVTAALNESKVLYLDFYSPIRTGFGQLSASDIEDIKREWL
jgi:hypothetical protein